jgi:prophage regulatory protein
MARPERFEPPTPRFVVSGSPKVRRPFKARPFVRFVRWNATELPRLGEDFASRGRVVHSDRRAKEAARTANNCRRSCSVHPWQLAARKWPNSPVELLQPRLKTKRLREIRGPERWLAMTSETDERLLRLRDVKQKSGLGTSTIYRRIADGTFPAPRSLGPNTVRWLQSEIDAWIKSLPSSRSGEQVSASS